MPTIFSARKKHHRHRSHQHQRPHHHRYHRCKSKGSARIKACWLKGARDERWCRQRQRIVNFCLESRSSDTVNRNNRFKRAAGSIVPPTSDDSSSHSSRMGYSHRCHVVIIIVIVLVISQRQRDSSFGHFRHLNRLYVPDSMLSGPQARAIASVRDVAIPGRFFHAPGRSWIGRNQV